MSSIVPFRESEQPRATIKSLSAEILAEVFAYHCSDCSLDMRWPESCYFDTPTLDISQTCQYWRNIALSQPELWSHMFISLRHDDSSRDLLELYLQRSFPALLTLAIDDIGYYGYEEGDEDDGSDSGSNASLTSYRSFVWSHDWDSGFWRMLHAVLVRNPRWHSVTFNIERARYITIFDKVDFEFADAQHSLINLRTLRCYWPEWSWSDCCSPRCFAFFAWLAEAPALETIQLSRYYPSFPLPSSRLTSFSFTCRKSTFPDLIVVLRKCPHLETLNLDTSDPDIDVSKMQGLVLPGLSNLTWKLGNNFEPSADILSWLTLPSLTTLSLNRSNGPTRNRGLCHLNLLDLLARSSAPLSRLTLTGDVVGPRHFLAELLKSTPGLTHLTIEVDERRKSHEFKLLTTALFTDLEVHLGQSKKQQCEKPPLPRLQFLDIACTTNTRSTLQLPTAASICSMVSSRRSRRILKLSGIRPLEYFGLTVLAPFDARCLLVENWLHEIQSGLDVLKQGGLNLHLWLDELDTP
ncbi:hypothetical protein D9758_004149 [Tetrapyrgos nigripes]|uniref:F-box domain-containing protein n=1 Tax=Tetrapyrgos nigripes TaxID=182062 RepID=A0A8H5LVN8_9AGAR|nr:hypothetical protein D9758_004149 [Tetrapyrgos nigripes]